MSEYTYGRRNYPKRGFQEEAFCLASWTAYRIAKVCMLAEIAKISADKYLDK